MLVIPLSTSGCVVPQYKFWKAIQLYHDKPQVINRKIIGSSQSYIYEVKYHSTSVKIKELLTYSSILYEVRKISELSEVTSYKLLKSILEPYDKTASLRKICSEELSTSLEGIYISVRRLLPKQTDKRCVEVVLFDKDQNIVTFLAVEELGKNCMAPPFPYHIEFMTTGHIRLLVDNFEDADTSSAEWLADKLFPKFIKWASEYDEAEVKDPSLKLISIEIYSALYKNLKEKYAQKFVKIWPENTDPLKFVYEDVAIAAYLLCLWKIHSPEDKPSFVDLGCGNGLLVYILNEEGFPGYGIDVRSRKIWKLYPDYVKLEVKTIIPSTEHLFPDVQWIIGNHSDELTPWIPVISARSSYNTNFFLLPCCSYDFRGKKYNRIDTSKSQYCEYLEYVENICKRCGFITERDKLRIPSTKKTCIISYGRSYRANEFEKINAGITEFINKRCGIFKEESSENENWIANFEPRSQIEKVRNCTRLDRTIITNMVNHVVTELLKKTNIISKSDGSSWNTGGSLLLSELVQTFLPGDLKQLKKECGGLQTLLRNHRYIFEVVKGSVKLRIPSKFIDVQKFKSKPCWFKINHPDGCLYDKETCSFNHNV